MEETARTLDSQEPAAEETSAPTRSRAVLHRISKRSALAVSGVTSGVLIALSGLMLWHHHRLTTDRSTDQQFVEAARAGVAALLTIDHSHAQADVQRVLDLSTGSFHDEFAGRAADFVKTADSSKVVTRGSVSTAGLDSRDGNNAVILLTANSQVTNANGAKEDPRSWRMSVTVSRVGNDFKMSDVEFVP